MVIDALSPVAPARIRCLLLPCGRITASRFHTFVERLRKESAIRLGDVSPNTGPNRNMFSPMAFPTGLVFYELSTSIPPSSQLALAPFELYRKPLAVVGIADGLEYSNKDVAQNGIPATVQIDRAPLKDQKLSKNKYEELEKTLELLRDQYASALVHRMFIFDSDSSGSSLPGDLVPVPCPDKSNTTTIKTIMCDLSSHLLGEMTAYAKAIQALPSIETPRLAQTDRPTNGHFSWGAEQDGISRPESRISGTATSRSSSPGADGERSNQRSSIQGYPTSGNGTEERSRSRPPLNGHKSPLTSFDQMNALPGVSALSGDKERTRRASRDRIPVHGFGSGSVGERARNKVKARIGVILGSLYLLAGRWPDAMKELVDSATIARAISDHVWHGKALDYILVCMLMCGWAGMDFEIPQICYPLGDKTSPGLVSKSSKHISSGSMPDYPALKSPNSANRLVSLQNLCSLLPDLVNNILHLYVRAATFTADQIPQISFSQSTIRFAKLLAVAQGSHGTLDDRGLRNIVLGIEEQVQPDLLPSQLSPFSSKSDIAAVLFRALPNSIMEGQLDISDRVNILVGIASVLAKLGFHRKKAFILRELMMILLPALIQSRKNSAAELGVHPAASLSSLDLLGTDLGKGESLGRSIDSDGVRSFLRTMCDVYGVVLPLTIDDSGMKDVEPSGDVPHQAILTSAHLEVRHISANRAVQDAVSRSFGNFDLKLDILRYCINICEALPDLQGILRFSSDLLRTVGSGPISRLNGFLSHNLPPEDQSRILNSMLRTVVAAKKLGLENLEADYWDEFLIRGIEVSRASSLVCPISRPKSHLNINSTGGLDSRQGPFIYNPYLAKPSSVAEEPLLVAGEDAVFSVVCQNPYSFEIDIEWIKLDTSDELISKASKNVLIGPSRTQLISISGTPKSSGQLKLYGCVVKIKGCQERRFSLFNAQWTGSYDVKMKCQGLPAGATNFALAEFLTSARPGKNPQTLVTMKPPMALQFEVKVIAPQPNVLITTTSLSQSAIMLLEGEVQRFTLTLHNASKTTLVDFIRLSFNDSTSSVLQTALGNKKLSSAEFYEVELASFGKETFRWRRQSRDPDPTIPPQGDLTLEIEVVGKPGLSHGAIHIEYGSLTVPRSEVIDHFYTRQVFLPIAITVNASVDLTRNDFFPFTGDFAWSNQQRQHLRNEGDQSVSLRSRTVSGSSNKTEQRFQSLLERLGLGIHGSDHCLLHLDFFNAWPNPLSISVQVREMSTTDGPSPSELWKRAYTVHEVVQPGQTSRLVLLLPRISLNNPYRPIPSLHPSYKRQFIIASDKSKDNEAERSAREAFWLREEVLKLMRASWTEDPSGRTGNIELRGLRLTPRMIDAIKLEEVGIEFSLSSAMSFESERRKAVSAISRLSRCAYRANVDDFLTLTTTITNRLSHPIHPLLRLQSFMRDQPYNIALDSGKKFAFNGLMQQILPILQPGESREIHMGVVWLCKGDFEIRAYVEEIRTWNSEHETFSEDRNGGAKIRTADMDMEGLTERVERKVWQSREGCIVHVISGLNP